MQRIPRQLLAGVIVLAAGGGVAACAASQLTGSQPPVAAVAAVATPAPTGSAGPAPTPETSPTTTPPPAKPVLRLVASTTAKHGVVVVDGAGFTIYRSDQDSAAPPASRCVEACLQKWKPVLADDAQIVTDGVAATQVGTITRPDGTRQLTLTGWPLYRFVGDTKPGDIAGQCKGGFFAVTPTGGKSM